MAKGEQKEMESLHDAAARLLERIEQRANYPEIPVGCRTPKKWPAGIIQISQRPLAEKAGEIGAYSSLLTGQSPAGPSKPMRRDAITASNDNRRADLTRYPLRRVMPAVAARPYSDDSADQIARVIALRGSEWDY